MDYGFDYEDDDEDDLGETVLPLLNKVGVGT